MNAFHLIKYNLERGKLYRVKDEVYNSIQLKNLKTTGQMRHLKKKEESSRENVSRKRVNWMNDIAHLESDKIS